VGKSECLNVVALSALTGGAEVEPIYFASAPWSGGDAQSPSVSDSPAIQ